MQHILLLKIALCQLHAEKSCLNYCAPVASQEFPRFNGARRASEVTASASLGRGRVVQLYELRLERIQRILVAVIRHLLRRLRHVVYDVASQSTNPLILVTTTMRDLSRVETLTNHFSYNEMPLKIEIS